MIELEFSTRETKWSKCDSSLRYIHQAGKIDGKTTRCKSRNQRARLENCPNTEFSTSSVTKFLFFFFFPKEGRHIRCGRSRSIWIFYLSLSQEISWKGDDNSCFHSFIYIATFLDSSRRISLLFLRIYDPDINTME